MINLTQDEFAAIQDEMDASLIATKRGSAERTAAEQRITASGWEAAIALPQRTATDRQVRFEAIATAAGRWKVRS